MLTFVTIFFTLLSVRYIFRGPMFHESSKKLLQAMDDKKNGKEINVGETAAGVIGLILFAGVLLLSRIVYLFYTYDVDMLKWPTIMAFVILIAPLMFIRETKGEAHKWTPAGMLSTLIWAGYLVYILMIQTQVYKL